MGEIFIDETGARRSNMADENSIIRIEDKTPIVGEIGKILRGDTNSNIITFEMERYHDGEDLKNKSIRLVIKNELGIYTEDAYDIRYSNNRLRFSWLLTSPDTVNGDNLVNVEVYGTSSTGKTFSLNTVPFVLKVNDTIRASDSIIEIPDDWFTRTDSRLSALEQQMGSIHLDQYQKIHDVTLKTQAKDVVPAINELNGMAHVHNNKTVIDGLLISSAGELTYNNVPVLTDWVSVFNKPFSTLDMNVFKVTNGMLQINGSVEAIQKDTMPTASQTYLNKIYQYTGTTTSDFVNGYFYKCIAEYDNYGHVTGYKWDIITTQPDAGVKIYATKTELGTHASSNMHITQGERTLWTNKAEVSDIPTKVSELTDDVNLSQIHTHNNKVDVLDKLGVNSNNQLLFNGAMVASGTPISNDPKNIIVNKSDGLYVPETDLSDYSKTVDVITSSTTRTEKAIDNVIADSHTHKNKTTILDKLDVNSGGKLTFDNKVVGDGVGLSTDKDNSLSLGSDGNLYYKTDHTHNNKTILDNIGDNNGELTYNGNTISSDIDISNKANNILTKQTDGYYVDGSAAQVAVSTDTGNVLVNKTNGLYVPSTQVSISAIAGNTLENKTDGLYVPSAGVTISPDTDNILVNRTNGLYVPQTGISISADTGNTIKMKLDGLYADNAVETVNNVAPTGFKNIALTLDEIPDGTTRKLVTYETQNLSPIYFGDSDKVVTSEYLNNQFTNKNSILDKLDKNSNGALTFDGQDVATSSVNISADQDNIIENRSDGLYATVDLTPYETITHAQSTYATQAYAQNTHTLLTTDYLTKKNAGTLYMALAKYTDPNTNEIEGSSVKKQSIKYSDLDDVGQLDGVVLEQKLLNHLANTQIHNLGNLSSVLINSSEWNNGILTDFVVANDGTMQLAPSTTTTGAYTQNLATFVSKIYDVGDTLPFQLITFDAVYDPYIVNIKFYVRTGTTSTYSASDWTAWKDVTATKSLSGISTRYIQLKVEAQTANEYKNVKFNYVQMFYGQDTESEVTEAREGLTVKHATLKQHFDDIENRTVVLETAVNKYSTLDQTDINDIVADLDTIIATN